MTHEEDGAAFALGDVFHLANGFLLELGVTYGEDFVHDEDLGVEESSYGEAQADRHSGGVTFDRGVNIPFAAAEVNDLIELGLDLGAAHAQDGAVHEDILTPRHLAMEACANFQERTNTTMGADSAGGGTGDAGEEFQEGRFAGTVLTDDADDVALLDLEVDVAERPDVVRITFGGTVVGLADLEIRVLFMENIGYPEAADIVAEGLGGHQAEAVLLGYVVEFYCCTHYCIFFCFYFYVTKKEQSLEP